MKKLISSILFILITISSVVLIGIYSTNRFISEDSLKTTVEKIDVASVILNEQMVTNIQNNDTGHQILEEVYEIASHFNVSKEEVNYVINSNVIKDFASLYMSKFANYLTTGEESNITGEDIAKVVKDNIDTVANEAGAKLDDNSKNAIISVVDTYSHDIAVLIPAPKVITDGAPEEAISVIQKVFSSDTKIILFSVLGISIFLLVLVQFKKYRFMKWGSLAFMLSGVIICVFSLALIPTLSMALDTFDRFILDITSIIADDLKRTLLINGGIVIGISLVILLIYEKINRKLYDKELDQLASEIEAEFKESN